MLGSCYHYVDGTENLARARTETHNTEPRNLLSNSQRNAPQPLTWPGREFDQKGTAPSVEQGHCTLIAVKRYRDPHGLVDGIIFYCDLSVLTDEKKKK